MRQHKNFLNFIAFIALSICSQLAQASSTKFLSIADLHFDPFTTCTASPCPIIEELENAPADQWHAILEVNDSKPPQYKQDSNFVLLQSSLNEFKQLAASEQPQFILELGDLLAHKFQDKYKNYSAIKTDAGYKIFVEKTMEFLTNEIAKTFPTIDVYMSVGNNDSYLGDYVSDPDGPFFKDMAALWSGLIKDKNNKAIMKQEFSSAGYYALDMPQQSILRLIVLNTNYFAPKSVAPADAAAKELSWFEQELANANANHQQVLIALHIPAGVDTFASLNQQPFKIIEFWQPQYSARFEDDLRQYSTSIMGIFAGHLHGEWFQLPNNDSVKKVPVSFTPSISPVNGNNPAFKIYRYDSSSLQLQDFVTYFYAINTTQSWNKEYDFNEVYQPECSDCQLADGMALLRETGPLAEAYKLYYDSQSGTDIIHTKYSPYYWCQTQTISAADYQSCLTTNLSP